jgi:hypothetical protein
VSYRTGHRGDALLIRSAAMVALSDCLDYIK